MTVKEKGLLAREELVNEVILLRKRVAQLEASERELRQRNKHVERLALAAASVGDGICIADLEGSIEFVNPALEQLLGYGPGELLGRSVSCFYPGGDDNPTLQRVIRSCATGGWWGEAELQTKNGKIVATEETATPIINEAGLLLGYVCVSKDIGERKRAEEAERLRAQELFISMASHELRTPVTTIVGFAELLLRRDPQDNLRQEWLRRVDRESRRLAAIIDDLLNVSRIQSGKLAVNLEALDIRDLVEEVLDRVRPTTDKHSFVLRIPAGLPQPVSDRDKVTQVLINLLDNAVKYSPKGGRVTISVRYQVHLERVVVTIADQGIGIRPEHKDTLFSAFQRIRRCETQGIKGTGLGLYIVKTLSELLQGEVWVESDLNRGSTFFFSLPLTPSDGEGLA